MELLRPTLFNGNVNKVLLLFVVVVVVVVVVVDKTIQYPEVSSLLSSGHFNPFTAKCGQRQISTKFANFIF